MRTYVVHYKTEEGRARIRSVTSNTPQNAVTKAASILRENMMKDFEIVWVALLPDVDHYSDYSECDFARFVPPNHAGKWVVDNA